MFVSVEGSSDQGKAVLKARGIPHIDEDPDRTRIDGLAAPEDLDVVFEVRHRDPLEGEVAYKLDALVLPDCHVLDGEDPPDDRPGAAKRADHLVEAPMRLCPGDLDHVAVELTEGLSLLVLADVTDPQQGQGQPQAQGGAPPQPGKGPRVPGQPKDVAPDVVVTDLKGEVLVRGVGGGGRILAVLPEPEPGGYVVSVRAPKSHPRLETPYRLTVIRVPPCPEGDIDDFAAAQQGAPENDGPDQATQIRPGSMTVGRVCPGDEDWYAFEADEKEETQVEVSFDRSRAKLMVDGYLGDDVSGPAKEAASVPSGAVFTVPKLEEAEAPKVRVKGEGEEDQGIYLLRHVAQPPRQQQDQQDQQQNQDQQDQQDQEDQEQGQDKGQNQQQEQPSALDQLLQDMDQNPKNLEAEEAAKKLQGTIVVPLRDW